jgi:hypothetical protein
MKQEAQIVMLPTEDINAPVCIYNRDGIPTTDTHTLAPHTNQHLYITVSQEIEPIKEGDWYLFEGHTIIKHGDISLHKSDRKIIATTDTKLGIPCKCESKCDLCTGEHVLYGIHQSFIEEFWWMVCIDKVMVEYELFSVHIGYKLKVNSDNTINISLIEEKMYSGIDLMGNQDGSLDHFLLNSPKFSQEEREVIMDAIHEWIKENL